MLTADSDRCSDFERPERPPESPYPETAAFALAAGAVLEARAGAIRRRFVVVSAGRALPERLFGRDGLLRRWSFFPRHRTGPAAVAARRLHPRGGGKRRRAGVIPPAAG